MNRRTFLAAGAGIPALRARAAAAPPASGKAALAAYTEADHRRRLENIRICEQGVRKCVRKHLVTNYIPGHAVCNTQNPNWEPDERDDKALSDLRRARIGIIQPWSNWAGTSWGRNHMAAQNPPGFRRFVELAHKHGLKVLPYTSTNFFERTDPAFRPDWAWPKEHDLVEYDYHLAHCSPASPGWRAHMLPRVLRIMDEYGVDGLYNDLGYKRPGEVPDYYGPRMPVAKDDVVAFDEGPAMDGALGDLLALIYDYVKARGGIYKLHKEGADTVYTAQRVYDYLWVGEAIGGGIDFLREKTKNYDPYVIPQRLITAKADQEEETFLNSVPYLQFPMMGHGQEGEQGAAFRATFERWLKLYLPMVEEGTRAYIDIADSDLTLRPVPRGIVITAFANRELYVVLANLGRSASEVALADAYQPLNGKAAAPGRVWSLASRSILILQRQV